MKALYSRKSLCLTTHEEFTKSFLWKTLKKKPQQTNLMKHKDEVETEIAERYNHDNTCVLFTFFKEM